MIVYNIISTCTFQNTTSYIRFIYKHLAFYNIVFNWFNLKKIQFDLEDLKDEAEKIKEQLEGAGAQVDIK